MNPIAKAPAGKSNPGSPPENRGFWEGLDPYARGRLGAAILFVATLSALFYRPLAAMLLLASHSELNSYILLVPVISAYLLFLERKNWPKPSSSPLWAIGPFFVGLLALLWGWHLRGADRGLSLNDSLTVSMLAFVAFLTTGGFLILGWNWMAACAFPVAFLLFMIPLPDAAVVYLETASKLASADAAEFFFNIVGLPFLRDGVVFQLPGIVIRVAQECSGIHSSLVLFITSLIVSHLLLRTAWRRLFLIIFVIPLGVLRNGFRILVIAWLCVHVSPRMIDSPIHHKGGPLFFALSLVPVFLVLWWLKTGERRALAAREGRLSASRP